MSRLTRIGGHGGAIGGLIAVIAIAMASYHLYTAYSGVLAHWQNRAIHLSFGLVLVFLIHRLAPTSPRPVRWFGYAVDAVILAAILFITWYTVSFHLDIQQRMGSVSDTDKLVTLLLIVIVLEGTRRVVGLTMALIGLVSLLFVLFGSHIPGQFGHPSFSTGKLTQQFFNSTGGVYGSPLAASAVYITLFIIFGAFLNRSGAGDFFGDLSRAVTGRSAGGPAKAAVVASGLTGSVTGSAVANVATTGPFTIPVMVRYGYSRNFAGAVEASASTGGQVLPPVMGATAFIIAEFTQTPYSAIAFYAIFPALLYFLGVFLMVHFEAKKKGITTLEDDEIPSLLPTLARGLHNLVPLLSLIAMLFAGLSPMKAGFYAILLVVAMSWMRKDTRMLPRDILLAMRDGAVNSLVIVMACATAGIIVGSISITGLGLKFSAAMIGMSGGYMLPALLLTALASLILGMGMISISAYVILASLAAPALVNMGAVPVAAHLFVYFFGILSNVTPPICVAAFTAAGIAGGNQIMTGLIATRLAAIAFVIPFMFVLDPRLLWIGETQDLLLPTVSALFGVLALAAALQGFLLSTLGMFERVVLFVGALAMLSTYPLTDMFGAACLALVAALQLVVHRRRKRPVRGSAS